MKKMIFFLTSLGIICVSSAKENLNDEKNIYNLPKNKQGIADLNAMQLSQKRYTVLRDDLSIDMQKFSFYWENAEDDMPSSLSAINCNQGYVLFPIDEQQKQQLGFNNYHCYKKSFIKNWTKIFDFNKQFNMIIAVGLWTTPAMYRNMGCEGFYFPLQKKHLNGGCYPSSEHYDDYEDWIRFTAYTFGKYIDHYIVWNEVDTLNWADSSTQEYPRSKILTNPQFHMERSFKIYTTLLKSTIKAVEELDKDCINESQDCKNLVYVSLTGDWYSRDIITRMTKNGDIDIRWRNMNLLDYLWNNLGLDYNWSIAIHPYGNVYDKNDNALRFSTLWELSAYQKKQIDSRKGTNRLWLEYPQSKLFASEQNIGGGAKANDWKNKAKFICESYAIAQKMPELIAITHNHFQDNINSNEAPTLNTMLPSIVKEDLSDALSYETFQAYSSTTPANWGNSDNHYCCEKHQLGCVGKNN